jgi:hypothetical protein
MAKTGFLFDRINPTQPETRWTPPASYPASPGYAADRDTSIEAAEAVEAHAEALRERVMDVLDRLGPMTADQVALALGVDRLAIRPRCTELHLQGKVEDSGARRPNVSGKRAIVWRVAN